MITLHLQEHLILAGHDPGRLDGKPGPRTTAAVRSFQAANGLDVDGIAGPLTEAALRAPYAAAMTPPNSDPPEGLGACLAVVLTRWEAIGVRELPGNRGPWVRALTARAGFTPPDGVPWCGITLQAAAAIVQEWSGRAAPDIWSASVDRMVALARAAGMFVAGVDTVRPGDLVVTRTSPTDWTHVAVVLELTVKGKLRVISGNSGDRVRTVSVARDSLDTIRLPSG